jgi:hypothetical protein
VVALRDRERSSRAISGDPDAPWPAGAHWVTGDANAPADRAHGKDLQMQAFSEAAEGIRTLDLLHGKQTL